jgi:hypothetical protein
MKITGSPQDDTLGCKSPKSNNSFNFIFNYCSSGVDIQYGVISIGSVLGFNLIVNSNFLSGGKSGNSYRNTCANSHTTRRFSNPSASPFSFITNISYSFHHLRILLYRCRKEINLKDTSWFLPTITVLCPKSSVKLKYFV